MPSDTGETVERRKLRGAPPAGKLPRKGPAKREKVFFSEERAPTLPEDLRFRFQRGEEVLHARPGDVGLRAGCEEGREEKARDHQRREQTIRPRNQQKNRRRGAAQ